MQIEAIKTNKEISRIKREGVLLRLQDCIILYIRQPGQGKVSFAIRVKKSVGNAVARNKMRRRIRQAVNNVFKKALSRENMSLLIVWVGKKTPQKEIEAILEQL